MKINTLALTIICIAGLLILHEIYYFSVSKSSAKHHYEALPSVTKSTDGKMYDRYLIEVSPRNMQILSFEMGGVSLCAINIERKTLCHKSITGWQYSGTKEQSLILEKPSNRSSVDGPDQFTFISLEAEKRVRLYKSPFETEWYLSFRSTLKEYVNK